MANWIFNFIGSKFKNLKKRSEPGQVVEPAGSVPDLPAKRKKPAPEKPPVPSSRAESVEPEVQKKRKRRRKRRSKAERQAEQAAPQAATEAHENWDVSQFSVPPTEGKTRFHDLDLPGEVMHAVADLGFQYCSPIQSEILPKTLAGKDASGQAQTGTGKTAAFLITIIKHFIEHPPEPDRPNATPRALILAPTRELAIQISEEGRMLAKYHPVNIVTVYGGIDYVKQRRLLTEYPVDIVVATPGRLIDYCEHRDVQLNRLEILVIDEADRMLDMGFIPQVRRIVRMTPHKEKRQTMFFSATITGDVERLSDQMTIDPVTVEIEPEQVEVASVEQLVYLITRKEKPALLYHIIESQNLKRVIIFCNRRDETHRVMDLLRRYGINGAVISGEIAQNKRQRTLELFRAGQIRVLVATDVAGRGLHIDGVSHVINYTLPHEPESYVHRIGRTGRAGATGTSVSFACESDSFYIPAIEEFLGHELPCSQPDESWLRLPQPPPSAPSAPSGKGGQGGRPPRKRKRRRPRRQGGRSSAST